MKRYLLYIVLTVVLSTAGCTRGQWLDEIVAQRDEQEDVVPILRAAQEKGLTVNSVEEIERTNKHYTVDTANGYTDEEFKRYRLVFSDKTTVEFDVLGILNGVQREYYAERGLSYISEVHLSDRYVSVMLVDPNDGVATYFVFLNTSPNAPKISKIYYTSTDGQVVTPNDTTAFGANIVSNTYENGQGVITFDRDVTEIGYAAFASCSHLESIIIPNGVTSIGEYAFSGCTSLASITIPDGVTSIGWDAFEYCSSLASVTIGNGVTSIGECAFIGCSSLAEFSGRFASEDGRCLIVDGVLNSFAPAGLTEYTIPEGVTSIGENAFYECSSLTSITIPEGVTSIGWSAFYGCSSLAEVYCKAITPPTAIPYSFYGWGAFDSNASGRKIYVPEESVEAYKTAEYWRDYADAIVGHDFYNDDEDNTTNIPDNEIWYTSTDGNVVTPYATNVFGSNIVSNTYADGQGVITFAGNVTTIGSHAFESCTSLTSITIPDGVTEIGYQAFYGCSSLASVTLPDSVTEIGGQAFYGCTALTSVTIPDGVTSIVATAFYGCASLISITIPDSVTYIGEWAFKDCLSLTSVYCMPTTPPTGGTGRFDNGVVGRKIYVPAESVEAYKSANYWSDYADDFVAYDFENGEVVNLENRKIYYTSTDGKIVTPNDTTAFGANIISNTYADGQGVITFDGNVTSIGEDAFYCCWRLASITIPEGVTSIGYYAFKDCSSLASVTIPDGVTSIGGSAFNWCSSLASITIPDSVTSIGDYAFYNCDSLTSITIPDSVTSIGETAFSSCASLTSVTIGNGVTSIGSDAFSGCTSLPIENNIRYADTYVVEVTDKTLTSYTLKENVRFIGNSAFSGCTSLTSVTIPDSVTEIGESAFEYCKSLVSITIPDGVTSIEEGVFYYCESLTSITIPEGVTSIGRGAFDDCSSLASITIPDSVTSIGDDAFEDCSSLTSITIPEGVTSIGKDAFRDCSSLASVTIPEGVTEIGEYAFYNCKSLASITIPEGVTSIGYLAFSGCSSLASIIIPDSVTSIGYLAFRYCHNLAEVYCKAITPPTAIPDSSSRWGAFDYNASGRKIYVPTKSVGAYKTAEWWSEYADAIEPYVFE